jgi:hypothetical protein
MRLIHAEVAMRKALRVTDAFDNQRSHAFAGDLGSSKSLLKKGPPVALATVL